MVFKIVIKIGATKSLFQKTTNVDACKPPTVNTEMKVCNKKSVTKRARRSTSKRRVGIKKRAGGTRRRHGGGCSGRCMHPGPIVRNPYLNFLRKFRRENCGLTPVETIRRGAKAWKSLSIKERLDYIKEVSYEPKKKRIITIIIIK